MKFDQLTYIMREDAISLSPVIVLSQPSPVTFTLTVNLRDINTTAGKLYQLAIWYSYCVYSLHIADGIA